MAFSGEEFFQLAERVVPTEQNEEGYRTGISRVYYACHLVGREHTRLKGWFAPEYIGTDHHRLIKALAQHVPWHGKLNALLRLREHADYHLDARPTASDQFGNQKCGHCFDWKSPGPLVTASMWLRAQQIARDLLPRLKQI